MDSANLENCAWNFILEDDWDQYGVLSKTWFLADCDIIHCLKEGLINIGMVFLKIPKYLSFSD